MNGATGWKVRPPSAISKRPTAPFSRRPAPSVTAGPMRAAWAAVPAGTPSWTRTITWCASGMNSSPLDDIQGLAGPTRWLVLHRFDKDRPFNGSRPQILRCVAPGRADDADLRAFFSVAAGLCDDRQRVG